MLDDVTDVELTERQKLDHTLQAYGRLELRIAEVKRERDRLREALARLDGKVEPGWRQAVITQALRPLTPATDKPQTSEGESSA